YQLHSFPTRRSSDLPGLINAYKTATQESINNAEIIEKYQKDIYAIDFEYLQMNNVMRIIKDEDLTILSQNFNNNCRMEVAIRSSLVNRVTTNFSALSELKLKYLKTI